MKKNEIFNAQFFAQYIETARKGGLQVAVHSGLFHADDVFSVALLDLAFDLVQARYPQFVPGVNNEMRNFVTLRTRDQKVLESADIVIDVGAQFDGRKYFDHHQDSLPKNVIEDIPHSALGLLAETIIDNERILEELRRACIISIEARDNGLKTPEGFSEAGGWVSSFNPNWDETDDQHSKFIEAAYFAKRILDRTLTRIISAIDAEEVVDSAIDLNDKLGGDPRLLVLEKFVPWKGYVFRNYPDIEAAVFLGHSGWTVTGALAKSETDLTQKFYFPEGFTSEGMTFLHKSRFMAVFTTKEHAINAAKQALGIE